jgi:hypothetical protein
MRITSSMVLTCDLPLQNVMNLTSLGAAISLALSYQSLPVSSVHYCSQYGVRILSQRHAGERLSGTAAAGYALRPCLFVQAEQF